MLPLTIHGAVDVMTGDMFVSNKLSSAALSDTLKHELCHLTTRSNLHGKEWHDLYNTLNPSANLFTQETGSCFPLCLNIGNISGIQNILTDYHLLQAYRKFSQKVLGTEGHWEVINEGNSTVEGDSLSAKDQLIRLYPTPKGAYPVVVMYVPVVNHFRSPQARAICYEMMEAEMKCALGMIRRKITGMPTPDGGSISYDGAELVAEGTAMKEALLEKAIHLGEPLGVHIW